MGILRTERNIHWEYYLAIEDDLKNLARYIDFDTENDKVFSIELSRLLLMACSEVDVVFKLICNLLEPSGTYEDIADYRTKIKAAMPFVITEKVYSAKFGLELTPFEAWGHSDKNPLWWRAYNHVKHERNKYYTDANLKNVLNAVAGLHVVIAAYHLLASGDSDPSKLKDVFHELKNTSGASVIFEFDQSRYYHNLVV